MTQETQTKAALYLAALRRRLRTDIREPSAAELQTYLDHARSDFWKMVADHKDEITQLALAIRNGSGAAARRRPLN